MDTWNKLTVEVQLKELNELKDVFRVTTAKQFRCVCMKSCNTKSQQDDFDYVYM